MFVREGTGGGCEALFLRLHDGSEVMLTDGNFGVDFEDMGCVEIGHYPDEDAAYEGRYLGLWEAETIEDAMRVVNKVLQKHAASKQREWLKTLTNSK